MSSPATITETPDNTQPHNSLLIIPDGSPLWLTPGAENEKGAGFGWRFDMICTLMEQLPSTHAPVLIGAPTIPSIDLVTLKSGYVSAWHTWQQQHGIPNGLTVMVRPLDEGYLPFVHGADSNPTHQLWLVTKESFGTPGLYSTSRGWADSLKRLGFNISKWDKRRSLVENLEPRDGAPRLTWAAVGENRLTNIVVGSLVDQKLVTTSYDID